VGRTIHSLAWDVALAGPWPPKGTRDGLLRAVESVPFDALRALGEGLAGRDTAARLAGVRRALALPPGHDEAALVLARLLVDAGNFADARAAVSELARAALLDPYASSPHRLLGRAARSRGESEKALAELRTALWCRDDPALRREIADVLRSMGRGEEARRFLGEP
jgi:hypothetical protein